MILFGLPSPAEASENWRPFEELEPATILSRDAQIAGWVYL
jgi:hypothetical protein